jgi:hypothetical protein
MKLTISKSKEPKGTISGLTMTELDVISNIVDVANRRCFNVSDKDDDRWYSNDDFILVLNNEQRKALAKVGNEIRKIIG